ncbi:MAG: hypothetical protein AAGC95_15930 [Pseudomonadota bacterium]
MQFDEKNVSDLYHLCMMLHEFLAAVLEREIASGLEPTRVWNKEKGEWEIAEQVTPEYLLAYSDESRAIIEKANRESNLVGLSHIMSDLFEKIGLEFEKDTIRLINMEIEKRFGERAPKIKSLP